MTLGFGLVGYGGWGGVHARAITRARGCQLIAVAVRSEESRARVVRDLGVPAVGFQELLVDPRIEVVDVAAPNPYHYGLARDALLAGKHVLVEKPIAGTVEEALELVRRAELAGRTLMVNQELRLFPAWRRLGDLVARGTLGRPRWLTMSVWRDPPPFDLDVIRSDGKEVGNWFVEEFIHYLDLVSWYFLPDEPSSVELHVEGRSGAGQDLFENCTVLMRYDGGRQAVVTRTRSAYGFVSRRRPWHGYRMELTCVGSEATATGGWTGCTRATIPAQSYLVVAPRGQTPFRERLVGYRQGWDLRAVMEHMAASARTGTPPIVTGRDGARALALCQAALASLRTSGGAGER